MSPEIIARPSLRLRALRLCNRAVLFASTMYLGEWGLYGAFRCPFVVPFVSCQNCPVLTCPGQISRLFWGFWGIWLAMALCFGRAFCGWLCPGGLLNRVLSLNPFKPRPGTVHTETFLWGKYLLLAAGLWAWFVLGQPRVNVPIRVGEFWPSVWLTYEHAFPLWQMRFAILLAMLAFTLFGFMSWCRLACPLGGALELWRPFSLLRFYMTSECNDCNKCLRVCPMHTRPDEHNCTNCGDCIEACPKHSIHFGRKPGVKA